MVAGIGCFYQKRIDSSGPEGLKVESSREVGPCMQGDESLRLL